MTTPKQPQDRKKKAAEPFVHTINGEVISLPSLGSLMTFGFVRTHRHLPPDEQVYLLIEANADENTLAVLDGMDDEDTKEFIEAWQEHSGITPGESPAS